MNSNKATLFAAFELLAEIKKTSTEIVHELCSLGIIQTVARVVEDEDESIKLLAFQLLSTIS